MRKLIVVLASVTVLFALGCGGGGVRSSTAPVTPPQSLNPPATVTSVTVTPATATLLTGETQQFTAIVTPSGANQAVTWSVSGAGCTGATCGMIDSTGRYTAPAAVPNPATVAVTATSAADPTKFGSATVTVMPPLGSSRTVANLATARFRHEATLLPNGDVLITGGGRGKDGDHFAVTAQAELFDSVHLTFAPAGQVTRVFHTATLLRTGQVLLAGGSTDGFGTDIATAELFDSLTGQLQPTGNMASEREFHTATLLADGRVLIAGGRRFLAGQLKDETLRTAEIYDPVAKTFSPTGSMNEARAFSRATLLLGGRVLIAGGFDNGPLTSSELYDPATGSFIATGSMIIQREGYAATLLANGKVLITGGGDTTAELYDPASGLFTRTGVMTARRLSHTATLLPSGVVLIAGGGDSGHALASVELYDPATGQFALAAELQTGRFLHTATLLSDGSVLIVGGDNGDGFHFKPLSSAEIFK
jgi:hypothetical protein